MINYFHNILKASRSVTQGFGITWKHLFEARQSRKRQDISQESYFEENKGIVTVKYPEFHVPVPDNGRYTLHCEIDDCIVCDKCAKVCPVDCIAIESIKSPEVIGQTSDGTAKRLFAAQFDIDMAKCCFCGLCTTVCPTECLTMTDEYDYATYDREAMYFQFGNMTVAEMALRKNEYALAQEAKLAAKTVSAKTEAEDKTSQVEAPATSPAKPFRHFKPKPTPKPDTEA